MSRVDEKWWRWQKWTHSTRMVLYKQSSSDNLVFALQNNKKKEKRKLKCRKKNLAFDSTFESKTQFEKEYFMFINKNQLRINFYSLRTFFPHLGSFWVSTVPDEHCQKITVSNPTQAGQRFTRSKTWCDRQQLWKAVITGDTVTRLSIPIRGHGKSPEEGQKRSERRNNTKNYQDEEKKSAINKN